MKKELIKLIPLLTDAYKLFHRQMYPNNTVLVYSNSTARSSRHYQGNNKDYSIVINQPLVKMLRDEWNEFFKADWNEVGPFIHDQLNSFTGSNYDVSHLKELHELGYLPIVIKSLPDGTKCPIGVPDMTFYNTKSEFFWLTNYLETWLSNNGWLTSNSATLANEYREIFEKWALKTTGNTNMVPIQGHDFSMRGMGGTDSSILSGIGHLTSFCGSDTIPAYLAAQYYYDTPVNNWSKLSETGDWMNNVVATSVPATEHSVQCAHYNGGDELEYLDHILKTFPTGIVSIVCDGFDFWKFITEILPQRKDEIMARDGKVVVRPDSGDPVDIICGEDRGKAMLPIAKGNESPSDKGAIECLWDIFGGTTNELGYKEIDSHIGLIYGDSINLERAENICSRLEQKGFASTNWVAGIGSYTYQFNTRDSLGRAFKATYVEFDVSNEVNNNLNTPTFQGKAIFKDPKTGDGTKKSAKGLLCVDIMNEDSKELLLEVENEVSWQRESEGHLRDIFRDSKLYNQEDLFTVRSRIKS